MLTPLASALVTNGGSFFTGTTSEATNEALILNYSTSFVHKYSLSTFVETASASVGTNACAIALISTASAVTVSSTASLVFYYEIATNYAQSIAAPANAVQGQNQSMAGDLLTNVAMYVNSSTRTLYRINSNFTVTSLVPNLGTANDAAFNCIINKGSGRWLAGTQGGSVYELDNSGNILNRLQISLDNTSGASYFETNSGVVFLPVSNLAYDNNMLFISCGDGTNLVYDYTTGTKLYQYQTNSNSQSRGTILSRAASGEVVGGIASTASNPGYSIYEMDFTIKPLKYYDSVYTNSTNIIQDFGINTQTSIGWWTQTDASSNPRIYFFRISGVRPTTTRTFTVQNNGIDQKARLILLNEASGSTLGRPLLDTYMQSPATYRIPTGKTTIEMVKVGEGEDALWDCSTYTT